MKDVQCYELFGGIALKNHAFSFHSGRPISQLFRVLHYLNSNGNSHVELQFQEPISRSEYFINDNHPETLHPQPEKERH